MTAIGKPPTTGGHERTNHPLEEGSILLHCRPYDIDRLDALCGETPQDVDGLANQSTISPLLSGHDKEGTAQHIPLQCAVRLLADRPTCKLDEKRD